MPVYLYRFNLNHLFHLGKINRITKIYAENTYSLPFLARRTKLNQEIETAQASPFLFFHMTQWNKKTWWQAYRNADGERSFGYAVKRSFRTRRMASLAACDEISVTLWSSSFSNCNFRIYPLFTVSRTFEIYVISRLRWTRHIRTVFQLAF